MNVVFFRPIQSSSRMEVHGPLIKRFTMIKYAKVVQIRAAPGQVGIKMAIQNSGTKLALVSNIANNYVMELTILGVVSSLA